MCKVSFNDITEKDAYPLPRIDDTLKMLGGAHYFATLDLTSDYLPYAKPPQGEVETSLGDKILL